MQEQLDYYKRVARLANVGAWKVNLNENRATWDDVFAFIFEVGDSFGSDLNVFFYYYKEGEERNRLHGLWNGLVMDGVAFAAQFTAITAKGNLIQIETSAIPIYMDGKLAFVEGTVRNITEIHGLREENRLLAELNDNAFDFNPNPSARISLDGNIIKANQSFCNLLGYDYGELLGKAYQEILYKGEIPFRELFVNQLLSKEIAAFHLEKLILHKDGYFLPVIEGVSLVNNLHLSTRFFLVQLQDISEGKRAAWELRKKSAQFNSFIEITRDLVFELDTNGVFKFVSPSFYYILGEDAKKVNGLPFIHLLHPDDLDNWYNFLNKVITIGGAIEDVELRLQHAAGHYVWLVCTGQLVSIDSSVSFFGTARNINDWKETEQDLRAVNERFYLAADSAGIGVWEYDLVNNRLFWDDTTYRLFKITHSDFEGIFEAWTSRVHPDDIAKTTKEVQAAIRNEKSFDTTFRILWQNGEVRHLTASARVVRDSHNKPKKMVGINYDITERIRVDEQLEMQRHRLAGIIEGTNVGTWEWNIQTDETIYNDKWADMLGYSLAELKPVGRHTWESLTHPDDINISNSLLEKCFLRELDYYDCQFRMRHKNGNWIWIHDRGKVLEWTEEGLPLLMLGTHTDITERKMREQDMVNTLNIVSEQNTRLVNFAHIVSHNLRSHAGNFQILVDSFEFATDDVEKGEIIELIKQNANNLEESIQNLNEVVQIQTNLNQQLRALNLWNEIDKVLMSIKGIILESEAFIDVRVVRDYIVYYNPAYMESILLNFITNAIRYRHPDRIPIIKISLEEEENFTILVISDNGLGIDLALQGHKLFGMYKTFHNNKDARGIGLFITKNQIDAMGGKVEVESEVNVGTTFKVFIKKQP